MAASGFTPIQLYYSGTSTNVPSAGNLAYGELAINIADGKLYFKNSSNVVTLIASSASSAATVSSVAVSGGTTGLTTSGGPITTSGTITFAGTLVAANGGTGFSSYTTGDMLYASGATAISKLTLGALNYILTAGASGPQWSSPASVAIGSATNLAGGAANQIPVQTGVGVTGFITAPTIPNYVLTWTGSSFTWASVPAVTIAGNLNGGNTGDIVYQSATNVSAFLPDIAVGNALISGGVGVAPSYGKIGLTTHVSGTLPIANGGTNSTAAPTAGAVAYGTGTEFAFTTAGGAGQALISNGASAPSWQEFPQVPSFLLINAGVS